MDTPTRREESLGDPVWDSIIVGAGAAGPSAGVVLARAQMAMSEFSCYGGRLMCATAAGNVVRTRTRFIAAAGAVR